MTDPMNVADKLRGRFDGEMQNLISLAGRLADERRVRVAIVGGAVRDLLLDQPLGDADLLLEHPAQPIVAALAKTLGVEMITHERFFTFSLILPSKKKVDVVTAREETYPAPAKLPVVTPSSIEKDMKRRDFTINAVACWLNQATFGELLDPFSGRDDMKKKVVRALHAKSFIDDPTRLFRAARFAGRLGFTIHKDTETWILSAIKAGAPNLLSPVRLRHEFELIVREKDPSATLALLKRWNALGLLHPRWKSVKPASFQPPPGMGFAERLALWFHPFGKAAAQSMMTDLAFEKHVKVEVLSKLVQSRR